MQIFHEQNSVPVNTCILVDNETEARAFPKGDIRLAFCNACGFVRNVAFDAERIEYSGRYEETQGFSPTFNDFHHKLAADLIKRHGIRGKRVVEIGCGKGEFLALLCKLGDNGGLGFDPSYDDQRGILDSGIDARVIRDFYGPEYGSGDADVVVCKMTLEHIEHCSDFVQSARLALKSNADTLAFFQVPESLRIFRECSFEDIYYEHCSYFTPGSMARLFRRAGFEVHSLATTYAGQYLTVEARNSGRVPQKPLAIEDPISELAGLVEDFSERCRAKTKYWRDVVADRSHKGPVVIWGSGSKGVAFLHALEEPETVQAAVDINPNRQSRFMLGTGQPILAPGDLRRIQPQAVIVMNPIYREEIANNLKSLKIKTELLAL
jgi:hypothetical protein